MVGASVANLRIEDIVAEANSGRHLSSQEMSHFLDALELYECWNTYFSILGRNHHYDDGHFVNLIRLAGVHLQKLEQVDQASEVCNEIIKNYHLGFAEFDEKVKRKVVPANDWDSEAKILRGASTAFSNIEDRVLCLERLSYILEKKTFEETELLQVYQDIRRLDAKNIKALRFFKLSHMQNREWAEVASVLQDLLRTSLRKHEIYRYAQELAAVYLSQLDNPKMAIDTLNAHCEGSPLDDSAIRLEAYQSLGRWTESLELINRQISLLSDAPSQAAAYFRKGIVSEKIWDFRAADESYAQAEMIMPSFLDAIERRIHLAMQRSDWKMVAELTQRLAEQVRDAELLELLESVKDRLKAAAGESGGESCSGEKA